MRCLCLGASTTMRLPLAWTIALNAVYYTDSVRRVVTAMELAPWILDKDPAEQRLDAGAEVTRLKASICRFAGRRQLP